MVLKIYKHSVIRENHLDFPEHIFYEDNCAGPLWSLYFRRFERVEEPLYYYYQHAVSTVHHITEEKCRDRMKAAELLYTECENRGFLAEYRADRIPFYGAVLCDHFILLSVGSGEAEAVFCKRTTGGDRTTFSGVRQEQILSGIYRAGGTQIHRHAEKERSAVLSLLQDPAVCMEATGLKGGHGA